MTAPVPTNGFPAPGNEPGNPGLPPSDLKPGFVPQVPPVAPAPAAPAVGGADIAAAIAALQASLAAPANTAPVVNTSALETDSDPILRSMAVVMRTAGKGLDLDRVLGNALTHGNAELIDVAYLKEKAGDNAGELLTIAQGIVEAVNAKAQATEQAVYALAGSEANWDASVAAFNTGAAPELKAVIVQMLNSSVQAQVQAAAKMVVEFAKSKGYVPNPGQLIQNNGAASIMGQALSKDEFQVALQKLNPQDRDYAAQRGDLYMRRQVGKQQGK